MRILLDLFLAILPLSAGALIVPPQKWDPSKIQSPSQEHQQKRGIGYDSLGRRSNTVGWVAAYAANDTKCTGNQVTPQVKLKEVGKVS